MNKKYILLENDPITHNDSIIYQIQAIRDFGDIEAGDLGGYIQKESNLSHGGIVTGKQIGRAHV